MKNKFVCSKFSTLNSEKVFEDKDGKSKHLGVAGMNTMIEKFCSYKTRQDCEKTLFKVLICNEILEKEWYH